MLRGPGFLGRARGLGPAFRTGRAPGTAGCRARPGRAWQGERSPPRAGLWRSWAGSGRDQEKGGRADTSGKLPLCSPRWNPGLRSHRTPVPPRRADPGYLANHGNKRKALLTSPPPSTTGKEVRGENNPQPFSSCRMNHENLPSFLGSTEYHPTLVWPVTPGRAFRPLTHGYVAGAA